MNESPESYLCLPVPNAVQSLDELPRTAISLGGLRHWRGKETTQIQYGDPEHDTDVCVAGGHRCQ